MLLNLKTRDISLSDAVTETEKVRDHMSIVPTETGQKAQGKFNS